MAVSEAEVREQVQKLLRSELFQTSEVQRRLLTYLADKSLTGEASTLKEYTVGIEGIDKPESYDPRRDSSVRLQTAKLRQRILEYYVTVGQNDPILIDFPKGRFMLVFSRRESAPENPPLDNSAADRWRNLAMVFGTAFLVASGLAIWWGVRAWKLASASPQKAALAVRELWEPLLTNNRPTVMSIGTPLFLRLDPHFWILRDPNVNRWNSPESEALANRVKKGFPEMKLEPWLVFTGVGEASSAFMLGKTLGSQIPNLRVVNNSDLSWNEISSNNIIFVGPTKFNAQIQQLPVQQDLTADDDAAIRNKKPRAGELKIYYDNADENVTTHSGVAYGLISSLPGVLNQGHIVTIAGSGMPGMLAAAQFVTNELYASELLKHLRQPSGHIPSSWQAVIRCRYQHWVPVEMSYVLHHVLSSGEQNK